MMKNGQDPGKDPQNGVDEVCSSAISLKQPIHHP